MIEKIDTMCLTVSNVEESSNWYQEMLGFTVSFSGNGYRILRVGNSEVPLTIEEGEASSLTNRAYPIFFTKDLDIVYKKLRDHGVKAGEIQKDGVNTFFDFYDLDHNKLQVCFWE